MAHSPSYNTTTTSRSFVMRRPLEKVVLAYALLSTWLMVHISGPTFLSFTDIMLIPAFYYFAKHTAHNTPAIAYAYLAYFFFSGLGVIVLSSLTYEGELVNIFKVLRSFSIFFPFLAVFYLKNFNFDLFIKIIRLTIIGCGIAVAIGMAMHILGIEVHSNSQRLWLKGGDGASVARAAGITGNTGTFGMLIAVWGITVFFIAPPLGIRFSPLVKGLILGGILFALFESSSRGGMVMFLSAGLLYFLLFAPSRPVKMFFLVAAFIVTAIVAVLVLPQLDLTGLSPKAVRVLQRLDFLNLTGQSEFTTSVRLSSWATLGGLIDQNFLWGVGYKQFYSSFGYYIDNAFLLSYFESGIFAFLTFMMFWIALLFSALNGIRRGSVAARLHLIILIPMMLRMMTGGANSDWAVAPVIFLLMGATLRQMYADLK